MGEVVALPTSGRVPLEGRASLADVRGQHRALQVSWHEDDDDGSVVVLSTWRFGRCVASVRLTRSEAAALIGTLAEGLAREPSR